MSAFSHLKNFAIAFTRNLFNPSKNKDQKTNSNLKNTKASAQQKGAVRFISSKKSNPESAHELSDYTIF